MKSQLIGSYIQGNKLTIALLQQSPAHYYQRPDANYLTNDSILNGLSEQGGSFCIGAFRLFKKF